MPLQQETEVGMLVNRLRELGITQQETANVIGVHIRTLCRWISGESFPRKHARNRLICFVDQCLAQDAKQPVVMTHSDGKASRGITEEDLQFLREIMGRMEVLPISLAFQLLVNRVNPEK